MINPEIADSLQNRISRYENSKECNDRVWKEFTEMANQVPLLKEHRDHIEKHELGFGDRAFHYMWYLIFKYFSEQHEAGKECLEIGVYKGQVLSLWNLLVQEFNLSGIHTTGVSPLEGNFENNGWLSRQIKKLSPAFLRMKKVGNAYENANYLEIIQSLFTRFRLNFNKVKLMKGYSNDPMILSELADRRFDLVYIDGDHSYEGVVADLQNFLPKINKNGLLVMDDASFSLPGSLFWKGHEAVSKAAELIPGFGFRNILNVGHNRVYQKTD